MPKKNKNDRIKDLVDRESAKIMQALNQSGTKLENLVMHPVAFALLLYVYPEQDAKGRELLIEEIKRRKLVIRIVDEPAKS